MRVGVVGTGRMGRALAERLMEGGQEIVVWNRTPAKATPVVEAGARLAETPAQLTADVEVAGLRLWYLVQILRIIDETLERAKS